MSHGPSGLGVATLAPFPAWVVDCRCDLQPVINVAGSVSASTSIITILLLVFMFIIFQKRFILLAFIQTMKTFLFDCTHARLVLET
jgi:hypothetical protein